MERFDVERGDVTLAGERHRGGDGPLAVLLHAGVADRRSWRAVAERLAAEGMDAVAYDRRGFGETPGRPAEFRHLDDLLAVLDALGDRSAWLVGNSMGGALALDAALEAPDRVAGLVLVAPAVGGTPDWDEDAVDPRQREQWAAMERATEAGDLDAANRLEVRYWLDGPLAPEGRVGGAARQLALDMNAIALRGPLGEGAGESGLDAWGRLGEIRAPATVAWGDLDEPDGIALYRAIAGRLPALVDTRVLPGMAHLPSLERPEVVAALIAGAVGR